RDGPALGGLTAGSADRRAARDGDPDRRDHLPHGFRAAARRRARNDDRRLLQRISAADRSARSALSAGPADWVPRFYSPAVRRAARRIHEVLEHIIAQCTSGEASM